MKSFFKEKKILLFSPQFFGYGQAIAKKLEENGAEVHYFDERPGNDFMTKALIRINKSLLSRKIHGYFERIITSLQKEYYDYVVFLNLEAISKKDLLMLKRCQPNATFILYMWDSLHNKKHTTSLLPYFNLKHTFDKNDSENSSYKNFKFRPLFFLDEYRRLASNSDENIDLLFVGTIHSDRYELLMEVKDKCDKLGKCVDFFMYFQNRKLYYARKAASPVLGKAPISDFEFSPLPKQSLIEKLRRSKVVLDIQHPSQTGLTMRTIEMIGAKKKIITTNQHIKEYDFYDANNILCIDRKNIELNSLFFETEYKELDTKIYQKYSLDGWLKDLFSINS